MSKREIDDFCKSFLPKSATEARMLRLQRKGESIVAEGNYHRFSLLPGHFRRDNCLCIDDLLDVFHVAQDSQDEKQDFLYGADELVNGSFRLFCSTQKRALVAQNVIKETTRRENGVQEPFDLLFLKPSLPLIRHFCNHFTKISIKKTDRLGILDEREFLFCFEGYNGIGRGRLEIKVSKNNLLAETFSSLGAFSGELGHKSCSGLKKKSTLRCKGEGKESFPFVNDLQISDDCCFEEIDKKLDGFFFRQLYNNTGSEGCSVFFSIQNEPVQFRWLADSAIIKKRRDKSIRSGSSFSTAFPTGLSRFLLLAHGSSLTFPVFTLSFV